jgi:hypothetical protein
VLPGFCKTWTQFTQLSSSFCTVLDTHTFPCVWNTTTRNCSYCFK